MYKHCLHAEILRQGNNENTKWLYIEVCMRGSSIKDEITFGMRKDIELVHIQKPK